ncbi:glucose 1-dehydrogenase [Nakamurella panacisegetis]|uniref:Glucose 1-dehydrogenase n=1 Tax=Nakamurella panacisegetis TaxID=1090615 RepID=A0A1H0KT46_9ACTN|nr:SDR family oxidoreductase [Nakamurella panacisegetis]SDO58951.1 glucose 1-dehydrogenase [Nakamurella panacisegetis]
MTTPQVTVITGGGRGIGAATALRLARLGHALVINYLVDADAALAVAARARAAGAPSVVVLPGDVSDPEDAGALFARAVDTFGAVTGLVNNAGSTLHIGRLADTDPAVIRRVIDVNLTGAVFCARMAARLMTNGGCIVNVSSAAATIGSAGEYVHYAAAKAGVDALTVGLAKELAPQGIRVVGVAPGVVETEIHAAAGDPGRTARVTGRIPMGRVGRPDEIAGTIAWLFGPDADYVTGTTIRVAGGL